jgi:hypothetical protein
LVLDLLRDSGHQGIERHSFIRDAVEIIMAGPEKQAVLLCPHPYMSFDFIYLFLFWSILFPQCPSPATQSTQKEKIGK